MHLAICGWGSIRRLVGFDTLENPVECVLTLGGPLDNPEVIKFKAEVSYGQVRLVVSEPSCFVGAKHADIHRPWN